MTVDIEPLRKQLGRKVEDHDVATAAPLKGMIATFDRLLVVESLFHNKP